MNTNRAPRWPLLLLLVAVPFLANSCAKKAVQTPPTETTTPVPAPTTTTQPPANTTPTPTESAPTTGTFTASDLQPVFFDLDSYTLTSDGRSTLDADAKLMRAHSGAKVVVEGHCDERGTSEYNQALGEKRAQAARDYLTNAGIEASRLSIVSYGKERPFDAGHDEAAWAKNRRAHFTLR